MNYTELLRSFTRTGDRWTADVPDDWMQGRSAFGGLQAAYALKAMRELAPGVPVRSVQACFIAPVPAGRVEVRARVLRTGKSAVHAEAQLVAGNEVLCSVLGVFGAARASAVSVVPKQPPVEPVKPFDFPYLPGVTPVFTRQFAARWLVGALPFTGATGTDLVVELGLRDPGPVSPEHVLAFADFVPPVALSMLKQPAFGSSLTWMVEFLADRFDHLPLNGWRVDTTLTAARDGYSNQSLIVWGPGGVPVALGRQSMVLFG